MHATPHIGTVTRTDTRDSVAPLTAIGNIGRIVAREVVVPHADRELQPEREREHPQAPEGHPLKPHVVVLHISGAHEPHTRLRYPNGMQMPMQMR